MPELKISKLANLKPGQIFYSGRLYVVEAGGAASKARPWNTPPGATRGCVTLSRQSVLARFYPVLERGMVLPALKRSDFLVDKQPTAYTFEGEKDAHLAAQLDSDLVVGSGLSLQKMYRMAAWLLSDGAKPYRLYHYHTQSKAVIAKYAAYCAEHAFVECTWPDDKTRYWTLLFD